MNSSRVISAWDGDRLVGLIRVMDDSKNAPFYEKQGFKGKERDKLMEVKVFDNVTEILRDDMASTISKGCKVSIAAACFSMYAYKELKSNWNQWMNVVLFYFSNICYRKTEKQKREFYIPRLNRESSLYGTEFELKLRNRNDPRKAIAKECADWIRRKATFKSNATGGNMGGFVTVENIQQQIAYMPINGFTTVDIGCERGNNSYNMVNRFEAPFSDSYMQLFETLWKDHDRITRCNGCSY